MRSLVFALFALALIPSARAATAHDEQAWLNLTVMGSIKDDLVYFAEAQPRAGDGVSRIDQMILRGAVGWRLSPKVTLYQGYAHVVVPVEGGRDVNEERSFQQLSWTINRAVGGAELSSRTRLEQRWRSDGSGTGWRLREMLRYEHPLRTGSDTVNALIYGEARVRPDAQLRGCGDRPAGRIHGGDWLSQPGHQPAGRQCPHESCRVVDAVLSPLIVVQLGPKRCGAGLLRAGGVLGGDQPALDRAQGQQGGQHQHGRADQQMHP
jgi:hypothetical protein